VTYTETHVAFDPVAADHSEISGWNARLTFAAELSSLIKRIRDLGNANVQRDRHIGNAYRSCSIRALAFTSNDVPDDVPATAIKLTVIAAHEGHSIRSSYAARTPLAELPQRKYVRAAHTCTDVQKRMRSMRRACTACKWHARIFDDSQSARFYQGMNVRDK
jgi:hypothetical protein